MPDYIITSPDGQKFKVTAPEGATQEQILSFAQSKAPRKPLDGGSFDQQVIQGATLGFGDELVAGMRAPFKAALNEGRLVPEIDLADPVGSAKRAFGAVKQGYNEALEDERSRLKAYQQENPARAFGGQFLGGAMAGGPAIKAMQRMNPIAAGAITGAGAGAVAGFGTGEGLENRAMGAVGGGIAGGLLGAAIPTIGMTARKAWQTFKQSAGLGNPEAASLRRVLKAMEDDGLSPIEAAQRLDDLRGMGKPGVLADAGENLQSLGAFVAKQPGEGRRVATDFINTRQAGQTDRLLDDVKRFISPNGDFYGNLHNLMAHRASVAAPLYEKAYAKDFVWNDDLAKLMERPSMKGALARAHRIASEEGRDPRGLGMDFNETGDVVFTKVPSMQTLDYVKRGIDDVLEQFRDKVTGKLRLDESGRAINTTKQAFLEQIDRINPDYAVARAAFSGPSQSIEAMRMGRNVFRAKDAEQVATEIGRLSEGDKEFYKIGVARAIQDLMDAKTEGTNKAAALLGTPKKEKVLSNLFGGEDAYEEFKNAVEAESRMYQTFRRAISGSPTQPLQAEGDAMTGGALDLAQNVARGDLLGSAGAALRTMSERMQGVNQQTGDEVARMLFQSDPDALGAYIRGLSGTRQATELSEQALRGLLALPTAGAGVTGGLLAGQP